MRIACRQVLFISRAVAFAEKYADLAEDLFNHAK
jgi:hypothetical protein